MKIYLGDLGNSHLFSRSMSKGCVISRLDIYKCDVYYCSVIIFNGHTNLKGIDIKLTRNNFSEGVKNL